MEGKNIDNLITFDNTNEVYYLCLNCYVGVKKKHIKKF